MAARTLDAPWPRGKRPQSRTFPQGGAQWRHAEIADLIGSLKIKTSGGFLEKDRDWICPGCGRSKAQIVAPGQNVDIVAMIHRHHDHIENLISDLLSEANGLRPFPRAGVDWSEYQELIRRFCRFKPVDICHACNAVDPVAKSIVRAPKWFSFSPHGIRNMIHPPEAYAVKHEIDRGRLDVIWDKVLSEIDGLEDRIRSAIREERRRAG